MKKIVFLLPLLLLSFGCAQNHFNVAADHFADKVKILGVVPIIVDTDSDIKHPQKDQLIGVVTEMNRKYEQQFVRRLKATGNFYTVALLDGDPQALFRSLLFRREKRDDATIQYNKYFWKVEDLNDYLRKNNLDAVMFIVVSGLSKTDKVYSSTLMSSMTSDYNYLIMTAQVVDRSGNILWEYPNFRSRILTYYPMIALQYPDFSEAEANLSAKPDVKFKTIEGIRRRLDEKRTDYLLRETRETEVYGKQFDEMLSFLRYDPDKEKKEPLTAVEKARENEQPRPVVEPVKPVEQKPLAGTTTEAPAIPPRPEPAAAPPTAAHAPAPLATTAGDAGKAPAAEVIKPSTDEVAPASGKIY